MTVFAHAEFDGHEGVHFCCDRKTGLRAIIAIHDTTLGPALGGCRRWTYANDEEALTDVLRLSRGMSYKAALAGLPQGGGKSVILAKPGEEKTPMLFTAMARFVESLGGRYIIAEDVGITQADVELMSQTTQHVAGVSAGGAGDPSPATAWGVFVGIRVAVRQTLGREDLAGLTVAVQGLGAVGHHLCEFLAQAGARLVVADIRHDRAEALAARLSARAVSPDEILTMETDVLAPCALGAVLDDRSIPRLNCRIVAGSANNQLAETRHGAALKARGILYAPDYVVNAGGIINIAEETRPGRPPYDKERAFARIEQQITHTLSRIFEEAASCKGSTAELADRHAREKLGR